MMDELSGKLEELQIAHDIGHIDVFVSKLQQSSYISSATRSRVAELFRHELKVSSVDNITALSGLERAFSQSTVKYIPRGIVRSAIRHLEMIKQREFVESEVQTNWNQQQWFHHLVDSDTVVGPLCNLMDSLGVCRHNVAPSLCTIVLFGSLEEKPFFERMLESDILSLKMMELSTARKVFKYFGGVTIEGSPDCKHLMAGNDMKSVQEGCADGTIGGFFSFGDKIVSVTAAHVVPDLCDYKVPDADVAFVDVNNVQSARNPLYYEVDTG